MKEKNNVNGGNRERRKRKNTEQGEQDWKINEVKWS